MLEARPLTRVALQLYTVRALCATDFEGTLEQVARLGYDGVELAGLYGREPHAVGEQLGRLRLEPCAAHVPLERLESEPVTVRRELDALGTTRAVIPWIAAPGSADEAASVVERISRAASEGQRQGLWVGYHNHPFEFARVEGARLWDALVALPELPLELDLGWAFAAGEDPAALLQELAGRCPLVHVKDRRRGDIAAADCPVGEGDVGYARVVPVALAAGVEWLIAEQDEPGDDPLDAAARSLAALRGLLDGASR